MPTSVECSAKGLRRSYAGATRRVRGVTNRKQSSPPETRPPGSPQSVFGVYGAESGSALTPPAASTVYASLLGHLPTPRAWRRSRRGAWGVALATHRSAAPGPMTCTFAVHVRSVGALSRCLPAHAAVPQRLPLVMVDLQWGSGGFSPACLVFRPA